MSECITVRKFMRAKKATRCCARYGAGEESINHLFFENLSALQVWALSKISSNPIFFLTSSLFTNMNRLF